MLLKGQERVGDRIGWTLKGRWRGRRVEDTSRVIIRVHFIVRLLPDISLLLIRTRKTAGAAAVRSTAKVA